MLYSGRDALPWPPDHEVNARTGTLALSGPSCFLDCAASGVLLTEDLPLSQRRPLTACIRAVLSVVLAQHRGHLLGAC